MSRSALPFFAPSSAARSNVFAVVIYRNAEYNIPVCASTERAAETLAPRGGGPPPPASGLTLDEGGGEERQFPIGVASDGGRAWLGCLGQMLVGPAIRPAAFPGVPRGEFGSPECRPRLAAARD